MTARLQKIISQWGIASRRHAEELIRAGRVRVNGQLAKLGDTADPAIDEITIDRQTIDAGLRPQRYYFLLNKPVGVISSCEDPAGRRIVLDLLPPELRHKHGIHPVGRLDVDSKGALLLTNDGALTFHLTHPRHQIAKTYIVHIKGRIADRTLQSWRQGVEIDGKTTLPAEVTVINSKSDTKLKIVLHEGRNRQIRRVASVLGHEVLALERVAIGEIPLHLPERSLDRGSYRLLTVPEINWLSEIAGYQIDPSE